MHVCQTGSAPRSCRASSTILSKTACRQPCGPEGDKVFIDYTPLATGTGYVAPAVMLEFGARSTGEPSEPRAIRCDAAA